MAVAFLNTNTMQNVAASPVTDTTHMSVTASGTNRCAFAVIAYDGAAGMSVTAVSYGGQTMTACGAAVSTTNANGIPYVQVWYLVNPPTGLNTLSITVAGTVTDIYYNLVAFTGVNQTTPVRAGTYVTGVGATASASITVSSNTSDLTLSVLNTGGATITSTNQTSDGTDAGGSYEGASDHATTAATSVTHTWSFSGASLGYAMAGFSINGDPNNAGGVWVGGGSRRAPAKAGPFDQRGMLLSPYQRYSYAESATVTFLVSSADGFTLYEALDGANALSAAAVQQEALSSAAQAQTIITEALASLTQSATVQEEALQGLALVQAVIEEALASATGANTVRDESAASITATATVQEETLASAASAVTAQTEALASATASQTVIEEALASAALTSTVRYEALATALLAQIVQYEAGGIVSSPVSNSVTVILEALASATQSAANRLESLQRIAIAAVVIDEVLAGATATPTAQTESGRAITSSLTVQAEAMASLASLLTLILESGGLPAGVPMLGINAIAFAAMVTLATLDLMATSAASDSLATAAASDSLTTSISFDSLTTTSAFDG